MTSHYKAPTTSLSAMTGTSASGDIAQMTTTLSALDLTAQSVAKSLTAAFTGATSSSKSFEQVLTGIAAKMASLTLTPVAKSVSQELSQGLKGLFSGNGLAGFSMNANLANVTPFADGGIVAAPTFFGSGGGLGVMGERGAEAIMPLARGPDGALGLAMSGQPAGTHVVVNISTPDAESFRRSDQQWTASLARAVSRGQRSL